MPDRNCISAWWQLPSVPAFGTFFLKLWLVKRAYGKMSFKKQYEWQAARNLKVLQRLGLSKEPEETLEEFEMRIAVIYQGWELDDALLRRALKEREAMLSRLSRWVRVREWWSASVLGK